MPIYPDTCDKCGHRWTFHGGPAGCAVQTGYGCDAELCGCQERLTEPVPKRLTEPVPVAAVAAMLTAFINAALEWQDGSEGRRQCLRLGSRDLNDLSLMFGGQPGDKVIVWRGGEDFAELSVEDGVDEFLRHYDRPAAETELRAPATGPVCQKCHVPMVDAESKDAGGVAYRCPQCGDLYDVGVPV